MACISVEGILCTGHTAPCRCGDCEEEMGSSGGYGLNEGRGTNEGFGLNEGRGTGHGFGLNEGTGTGHGLGGGSIMEGCVNCMLPGETSGGPVHAIRIGLSSFYEPA